MERFRLLHEAPPSGRSSPQDLLRALATDREEVNRKKLQRRPEGLAITTLAQRMHASLGS